MDFDHRRKFCPINEYVVIWRIGLSTKPDDKFAQDDNKVPNIMDSKEKDNFGVNSKKELLNLSNNQHTVRKFVFLERAALISQAHR